MLPFNKRRNNSEIEIQTDEVEPVQLPPVRPPSVRPAAGASPRYSSSRPPAPMSSRALPPPAPPSRASAPPARPSTRPPISFRPPVEDNERTLMVAEKAPRRTLDLRQPKMPTFDEPSVIAPRESSFSDDEATRIHPSSSRSVLQMSTPSARRLLDESSGRIRSDVPPPPVSSLRVDEPRSAAAIDMSMTVGASHSQQVTSSTKFNPGRPTAVWAAALVAVGVFTGLAAALVARGGTDNFVTASAALIDPAQGAAPQIVATSPQNVAATIAAAPVQTAAPVQNAQGAQATAQAVSAALTPAASCAADVAPAAKAADAKVAAAPAVVADTKVADVKPAAVAHAAAPPVVHAAPPVVHAAPPPVAVKPPVVAAAPKPAAAPAKPAAKGSDIDSASAADALAKAQLEASLGR